MSGVLFTGALFVLSRCLRRMDPFPSHALSYFSSCCHIHVTVGLQWAGCSLPPPETIALQRKVTYPRFEPAATIPSAVCVDKHGSLLMDLTRSSEASTNAFL